MAAHVPTVVWSLRAPEYGAYVQTRDEDSLSLTIMTPSGYGHTTTRSWQQFAVISRRDARLLAKRINQCLDDTAAKGKYGRGSAS